MSCLFNRFLLIWGPAFVTKPTSHIRRVGRKPQACGAGKIVRLRQKLVDLADSVKGLFGAKKQQDNAVERLERLKVDMCRACSVCCPPSGSVLSHILVLAITLD